MDNTEQQIENFLLPFDDELTTLVQQLRVYLKKQTKPTVEMAFDSYNSVNIGYGFTEKAWDCFCGIIVYSKHLNLSFPAGSSLTDPKGLLQGTGSKVRHIRIDKLDDIKQPAVLKILKEARDNSLALILDKSIDQNQIKTVIKPASANKRRPRPKN